jgi:hypothetical protein
MVTYGLDQDIASKVIVEYESKIDHSNSSDMQPLIFSNYARIGL